MNGKKKGGKPGAMIATIVIIIALALGLARCGNSGSKRNVAHDPNGFLGYSDSFWEWYAKNN